MGLIFTIAMVLQIPRLAVKDNIKMWALLGWAIYGVIPTCHWYFEMGGIENKMVQVRNLHFHLLYLPPYCGSCHKFII